MKLLLTLLLFLTSLFSETKQVVFVLADNFNSTTAKLVQYEKLDGKFKQVSKPIKVNIGQNGLGWGLSNYEFKKATNEPLKKEGDKKAVAGIFDLTKIYTYHNSLQTKMPYEKSTQNHICVDDTNSNMYNKVVKTKNKKNFKSFENMLLKNETYEYVIFVKHNENQIKKSGSCIFLHVENPKKKETSGCTSMKKNQIEKLVKWLDIKKEPILIQLPKKACLGMKNAYPLLDCEI